MKTFNQVEKEISENLINGYESAVLGANGLAVKYGSLISEENELPDSPRHCSIVIWNNENIDAILLGYDLMP